MSPLMLQTFLLVRILEQILEANTLPKTVQLPLPLPFHDNDLGSLSENAGKAPTVNFTQGFKAALLHVLSMETSHKRLASGAGSLDAAYMSQGARCLRGRRVPVKPCVNLKLQVIL
ncbi:hypothetical protein V8E53_005437 [Lactarius tabidus]